MELKTEFAHYYFDCNKFRHKDVSILLNTIVESRLNNDMSLNSYGVITFDNDDTQHKYPNISYEDCTGENSWNKNKTNCIVFNLPKTKHNTVYDTLFLYHIVGDNGKGIHYGWIAYNTKTKYMTQKFFIDHDTQSLMTTLNRFFYNIERTDFLNKCLKNKK